MNLSKALEVLGKLSKWAPVIEMLQGMFGSPEEALTKIRKWELDARAANDERLARLRDRDEG